MTYPLRDSESGLRARSRPTRDLERRVADLEHERSELLRQLRTQQRLALAGALTAGLAHEASNHLTVMLGAADLGLVHDDPEALREALSAVRERGSRLHDTLAAFLEFMRGSRGRDECFPVSGALRRMEGFVGPMARDRGVTLMVGSATRRRLLADPQLIEQMLVNLGTNGVRAAARGAGRLVVSATNGPDGTVRLIFRDTGPGIDDGIRRRLFRPFVTANGDSGGNGLGLYVVRRIVQRYGGRILVESSSSGTRIEVSLAALDG